MNDKTTTVTIQLGNSDNKLSQKDWSHYVFQAKKHIEAHCHQVHFFGGSESFAPWQNVCCVIEILEHKVFGLRDVLRALANSYHQECIAWTQGDTEMLKGYVDKSQEIIMEVAQQSGEML